MLGLLPLELDTGPRIRKSSTLCSLLLLLTIALAVPGQVKSEEVGFGKHTKDGNDKVTLADYTIIANRTNFDFADGNFRKLYPDACDVIIEDDYIELRYNKGSKGCTVDLLSTNAANINKIKFKTGVRSGAEGGLNDCLDETNDFENSYNNTLPFAYSVNNTVMEKLNTGPYTDTKHCNKPDRCKVFHGNCMQHTSLQVSWSRLDGKVYAHTHLIGEDQHKGGLRWDGTSESDSATFNLEINNSDGFNLDGRSFNLLSDAACLPKKDPLFKPETWKITDGNHNDKHLLVFSLLRQTSSRIFKEYKLTDDHPNGPKCELFVQFDTNDYKMLVVNIPTTTPPTTSTTTEDPPTETEPPETSTDPSGPSSTTLTTTDNSFSSTTTTSRTTTSPQQQEDCGRGLYIAIGIAVGLFVGIVIAVLGWFWMRDKAEKDKKKWKQDAERAEDKRLRALYEAEKKLKGKKALGTFDEWKKNRKESDETTAFEMGSVDDLCAVIWKKVEKDHAKAKMQFLVDQFEKHRDKEVYDREYEPEKTIKGYDAVGRYQDWKMRRNIYPFEVIDGTSTALEYGRGKKPYDKPYLPGAVDESIPETE
uniref:Uncharacterized protein n=1 Tax=Meloidogyne enterolobii TaxID=390850 RepID=A0A6V7W854_MELEN|nr:unnamed protein product [Meloidogyne enterolobii]